MTLEDKLHAMADAKTNNLVHIGVRIPALFVTEAKRLAARQGISVSQVIRRAMARDFLSRTKEKP